MEHLENASELQPSIRATADAAVAQAREPLAEFDRWMDQELAKLEAQWEREFPLRGKTLVPWRRGHWSR
jgi:hypothetical protein